MSSRLPCIVGRVPLTVLIGAISCQNAPGQRERAPSPTPAPAVVPATPPVPRPWFEGTWAHPPSTQLDIDRTGMVSGHVKTDLRVRGVALEQTVRLEADGPGGHGVAVLRHENEHLRGFLQYAAPDAAEGTREELELQRTEPR